LKEIVVVGKPYILGPEGLVFEKPVTLRIALDSLLYNVTANKTEVIPPLLFTLNGRGEVEPLKGQRVVVGLGEAYIEGNTTHFSWVVKRMGTVEFKMRPERISLPPESFFNADFEIWNLPAEELKEGKPTDIKYAAIWPETWDISVGTVSSSKEIGNLKSGERYQTTFYYICRDGKGRYGGSVGYWVPQVEEPNNLIDVTIWIRGTAECVDEKHLIPVVTKEATITGVGGQQTIQAGTVKITIIPHEISLSVGSSFEATFMIQNLPKGELEEGQLPTELKNVELEPNAKGSLELEKDGAVHPLLRPGERWAKKFRFTCIQEGPGYHGADFNYKISPEEAPENYVGGGISGNGIAHCVEKEAAPTPSGVIIAPVGNRSCFYEGEHATLGAYDPEGNPAEVSWSSADFGISQTGSSLSYSFGATGSGIITATIDGVTTSIPVTVHELPEEAREYETLLSIPARGEYNELYTFSPVRDAGGIPIYNSIHLIEAGRSAILRLGDILSGPTPGEVFIYRGEDYLVTASEPYEMHVAPALRGSIQVPSSMWTPP
jgi:hypothetical protein